MKILVVDDHPLIVEDIIDELKEIAPKAECTGTSDPGAVMGLFEKNRYEVVMLDIDMPGTSSISPDTKNMRWRATTPLPATSW